MSTSRSSPLSAITSNDDEPGGLDELQDFLRDASYEPSDGLTPATLASTSTNLDDDAPQGPVQTKNKRASAVRRGKIRRPIVSCDQCQKKKSELESPSPCTHEPSKLG